MQNHLKLNGLSSIIWKKICQIVRSVALFGLSVVPVQSAYAGGFFDKFIDPKDSMFDTSEWVLDNNGFLPVPILITEPAVGTGIGMAGLFFHEDKSGNQTVKKDGKSIPPSISAVFGAVTENETWFAGGAHMGVWKQDRIRSTSVVARATINLDFYPSEQNDTPGLRFNRDGIYLLQDIQFRIKDSNWFLGGRFDYSEADISFKLPIAPDLPPLGSLNKSKVSGLGPLVSYDSRDNIFSPNRGIQADFEAMFHDGGFISDFTFQKYKAVSKFYWDPHPKLILGWRLDGQFSRGNMPFYTLPYIDLRGIKAMRYQGNDVLVTEVEATWKVTSRWSLVSFTGVGQAKYSDNRFVQDRDSDAKHTVGVGARYLIARRLGMRAGFDIAKGPEETNFYITVGSAWR